MIGHLCWRNCAYDTRAPRLWKDSAVKKELNGSASSGRFPAEMDSEEQTPEQPATPVPPAAKKSRSERREQAACDAVRTFVRDMHMDRFGATHPEPGEIDIVLRLKAKPSEEWALRFEPSLGEQLDAQLVDAQAQWNIYRAGHVHCFRCDSSECEHSLPPSPLSVFIGYAPNGTAEWSEFAQVLIEAKDDRVDQLFAGRAGVVARLQFGHDLRDRQLSSFGRASKTYAILGQVAAGYFPFPSDPPQKLSITFQVVEVRGKLGERRVLLNSIANVPGANLSDLLGSGWQAGVHRAREMASAAVEAIERRAAAAGASGDAEGVREAMKQVPVVLRRLAESLDRSARQDSRRTRHVEERRTQQRPVHKALDDVRDAPPEKWFYDEKAGTAVICGPQGRAHAFSSNGRHVTSFTLRPDSIEFRLRTHRWRAMTTAEADEIKRKIGESVPKGN